MAEKKGGKVGRRPRKADAAMAKALADDQALTRERIAAAAIDLLDARGLDGLTMRGLADVLGSGVMSLYWHVANKEEVFDLALDTVMDYRAPLQPGDLDWRGEVVHLLQDWRAAMLRHPWSAPLLSRRTLGPNILVRLERLGKCLLAAGVADADINAAIWSLWNYVIGAAVTRASFGPSPKERADSQHRLAELSTLYPTIGRSRLLLDDDWDGTFHKGLDFLIDGLAPKR